MRDIEMATYAYRTGIITDDHVVPSLGSSLSLTLTMNSGEVDQSARERDLLRAGDQETYLKRLVVALRLELAV